MTKLEISPKYGSLTARIFENEFTGRPKTLFYDLSLIVGEVTFNGERYDSDIELNFIVFPQLHGYKNLTNKTFIFPINPEPGYIDGSYCLCHAHNPCDITVISFGELMGDVILANLKGLIDFTCEGPDELGIVKFDWDVEIKIDLENVSATEKEAQEFGIL